MSDVLLVFVKEPRAGEVKSRLARSVGDATACRLYQRMAEAEIRQTAPEADEYARLFFYTPPEANRVVNAWLPGLLWHPQQGEGLGERMAMAFETAFRRGARRACIVGTDVPAAHRGHVREAFAALDDHDLVVGPTVDGGYYLLAMSRPQPELFRSIAWSTPSVLPATVERAGALGLSVRLLDPLRDVDTLDDVRAEWPRLESLLAADPALRAALAAALAVEGGR